MNVIIGNKANEQLHNLDLDIIKSLDGEFTVEELVGTFKNFFYQRMILDITAIKDYKKIATLQKLSISIDMDKTILLLDGSPESSSQAYLSDLVSMGIYNFTKNVDGINYLYEHPNSYRDVAQYHQFDVNEGKDLAGGYGQGIEQVSANGNVSAPLTSHGFMSTRRVIGVKNVTKQSGATTFAFMLRNQLSHYFKTLAIEVDKADFSFFKDPNLISATSADIENVLRKNDKYDVVIMDINNSKQAAALCTEIIYLIEPSVIKLNKMMSINASKLKEIKNEKIVLNQSLLTPKDVLDFEYESGVKIFFNMPPLDEREKTIFILNKFLGRLGFNVASDDDNAEEQKKRKLFGWL